MRVWTDSSAAIGICSRQGLGKLRHLDTHTLWIQQAVRCGRVDLRKIRGEVNPADLFTKHIGTRERLSALVQLTGCKYRSGRAEAAPLTRTATTTRTTMANAGCNYIGESGQPSAWRVLTTQADESSWEQPIMPHLVHNNDELDRLYPPMTAPEDLDDDGQEIADLNDPTLQLGQAIAARIAQQATDFGRRRTQDNDDIVVTRAVQDRPSVASRPAPLPRRVTSKDNDRPSPCRPIVHNHPSVAGRPVVTSGKASSANCNFDDNTNTESALTPCEELYASHEAVRF